MVCVTIISVNVPDELVEYIDEQSDNRSAFVSDLVENHRDSKSIANEAVAEFRKRQLQQKKANLESELELFDQELTEVNNQLQSNHQQTEAELEGARQTLESANTPLDASNPAVQKQAEKVGMTPVELVEKLKDGEGE